VAPANLKCSKESNFVNCFKCSYLKNFPSVYEYFFRQAAFRNILTLADLTVSAAEETAKWKPLDDLGKKAISSPKIPGASIHVVEAVKTVFQQSYGVPHAGSDKPWKNNTPVSIASITKPITATLVAILVLEKKLSFDDPISKHIPEYSKLKLRDGTAVRSPTIAECLSHTSGFP